MVIRIINEKTFRELLIQWRSVGRGLLCLPNVTRTNTGLSVSLVSIDNTVINTLEKPFKNYKAYLTWYGELLDNIDYYE